MVSHHPVRLGGHRHCGSRDIMFLVVEEQDSAYSYLNPYLLLVLKTHHLKTRGIL